MDLLLWRHAEAHEAAQGIMLAQLLTSTPILEVFVHEDEADDPVVLASVFENRSRKHARNAYWMLFEPEQLAQRATVTSGQLEACRHRAITAPRQKATGVPTDHSAMRHGTRVAGNWAKKT